MQKKLDTAKREIRELRTEQEQLCKLPLLYIKPVSQGICCLLGREYVRVSRLGQMALSSCLQGAWQTALPALQCPTTFQCKKVEGQLSYNSCFLLVVALLRQSNFMSV